MKYSRISRSIVPPTELLIPDKIRDATQFWRHWNHYAEAALLSSTGLGPEFKGRGELDAYAKTTPSAPQDPASGCAITQAQRKLRIRLSAQDRINMYRLRGCNNSAQRREMQTLLRKHQCDTPRSVLEAQYASATKQLASLRTTSWTNWCKQHLTNPPGKI